MVNFGVQAVVLSLIAVRSVFGSACADTDLIRYVDENGNDTASCLNSSDPSLNPCRTLTYALLEEVMHGILYDDTCNYTYTRSNLCVRLNDGVYRTTGELQVTNASNVTIEAVNVGQVTLQCLRFPNNQTDQWDDLYFLCCNDITVRGIIFERCGPYASGLYVQLTNGLTIEDCVFR